MRLPMQLNHINLWLLEDGDGWTIVDTGIRTTRPHRTRGKHLFAGPMGGRPLKRVIVTHMHPDHVGLAGWLVRKFDVKLWMSRTEYLMCRNLVADTGQEAPPEGVALLSRRRFSGRAARELQDTLRRLRARRLTSCPSSYRRIVDGEEIAIGERVWRVVGRPRPCAGTCVPVVPGANIIISGDQILPRISSNVSRVSDRARRQSAAGLARFLRAS